MQPRPVVSPSFKRELELMCGQPLNVSRSGSATQEAFVLAAKGDIAGARALLEAPVLPTLLRLGAPNVLVMLAQAGTGLIETYFVGQLGTDALAGMALVFPVVMLMQMTSAGAMGGGIASAVARALGAQRRADADALVLHSIVIALGFGSGLSPVAPGTAGTLWAWLAFLVLQHWLSSTQLGLLIAAAMLIGWWACTVTAQHMQIADSGHIVWDEIAAFWLVLWLVLPAGWVMQLAAFGLFRAFDALKPEPMAWADRHFKGFGPRGGFGPGGPRGRRGHGRGRRGDVRAGILALLAERDMHGYEMIQEIAQRTDELVRTLPDLAPAQPGPNPMGGELFTVTEKRYVKGWNGLPVQVTQVDPQASVRMADD